MQARAAGIDHNDLRARGFDDAALERLEDALADEPGSIRERVDRMQRRIARERGSGTLLSMSSDGIVDLFSTTGFELDHGVREYKHLAREACLMRNVDENGRVGQGNLTCYPSWPGAGQCNGKLCGSGHYVFPSRDMCGGGTNPGAPMPTT